MINFLLLFGLLTTNFLSTNVLIQSEQTIKEKPQVQLLPLEEAIQYKNLKINHVIG
jgi:hypothetical protein